MRIAMFVFNPCTRDPRVDREASVLAEAGHQVRVLAFLEPGLPQREARNGYEVVRADQRSGWKRFVDDRLLAPLKKGRKRNPQASEAQPVAAVQVSSPPDRDPAVGGCPPPPPRELPPQASEAVRRHQAYIARINGVWAGMAADWKPQVCHAHDLDTLQAAAEAARLSGARLVYDAHELWSEQHYFGSQEEVAYWEALEARLAPLADQVITVNESIASELERRYGLRPVMPLLNCPRLVTCGPERRGVLRGLSGGRPVALFQGGYMADRGLEELVVAAGMQDRVAVALRGYGDREPALRELAARHGGKVLFLPPVPASQMVEGSAEADIGLIPYLPTCLNNYLCTPNKLFEYMAAGVAVAGADVPELRRFIAGEDLGALFDPRSPRAIAGALVELAGPARLEGCCARSRRAAEERYNWEREGRKLVDLYHGLGSAPSQA